jgi:hypothetical protein
MIWRILPAGTQDNDYFGNASQRRDDAVTSLARSSCPLFFNFIARQKE